MRRALLCSLPLLAACSYQARDLSILAGDGASVGDGDDVGGDLAPSDGDAPPTDDGDGDDGPLNHAPVAVIRGAPTLTIPVGQAATVDGSDSYDPDGDVLSFTWAVNPECEMSYMVLSSSVAAMQIIASSADVAPCQVTLSVSDGQASSAVTVDVVASLHQTYVSRGASACSDEPRVVSGTRTSPFCTIGAGLAAARTLNAADVFVQEGTYDSEVAPLVVPPGVTVHGSLNSEWTAPSEVIAPSTRVILTAPGVRFEASGLVAKIEGMELVAVGSCTTSCAFVEAQAVDARFDNVVIDASNLNVQGVGVALRAAGSPDGTLLSFSGVVLAPASGSATHGVALDGRSGPLTATLSGSVTSDSYAALSVGVRSVAATLVTLRTLDVTVRGTGSTVRAYALLDGTAKTALTPDITCVPEAACDGSSEISVLDGTFSTTGVEVGTGAAWFGTAKVSLANLTVTVSGSREIVGVHTLSADNLSGSATVTATLEGNGADLRVLGWLDGVVALPTEAGSSNLALTGARIDVVVRADPVAEAGGIHLVGTSGATLTAASVTVSAPANGPDVGELYALQSTTTTDLRVAGGAYQVLDLGPSGWCAGIIDGVARGAPPVTSANLHIEDAVIALRVEDGANNLAPLGISLAGTSSALVSGNQISIDRFDAPSLRAVELVALRQTNNVTLQRNRFTLPAVVTETIVGVRDGGALDEAFTRSSGSQGLTIQGNVMDLPLVATSTALLRGMLLRGGDNVVVRNNALLAYGHEQVIGVQVVNRSASLLHNTVRLGGGSNASSVAVALYATLVDAGTLDIARNVLDLLGTTRRYAVVLYGTSGLPAGWITRAQDNLYASDALMQTTESSTWPPITVATATAFAASNTMATATYCPDNYHLQSRDALPIVTMPLLADDIDGDVRADRGPIIEVGADEIPDAAVNACN